MEGCSLDQLSDDVLCCIIPWLTFDETVRTSILSKRWKHLWKTLSIVDFDVTHMINPLSNLKKKGKPMCFDLKNAKNHSQKYREIVNTMIHSHLTKLTSCRFCHYFPYSSVDHDDVDEWVEVDDMDDLVDADDVEGLVRLVLERNKQLSSLILECSSENLLEVTHFQPGIFSNLCSLELTNYWFNSSVASAFECCEKLKTLKLKKIRMANGTVGSILNNCLALEKFSLIESCGFEKLKIQSSSLRVLELGWLIVSEIDVYVENLQVVALDSLICSIKRFKIYSLDLKVFSSYCNPLAKKNCANYIDRTLLQTRDVLERCSDLLESQPINIFGNLLTLSIELDLNNIRESMALSYMLKSCYNLNTLEITLPVRGASYSSGESDDGALSFSKSMFWKRHQIYDCFNWKLKCATVRGFTGKEQEVNFVKHLITGKEQLEKIYVICDSLIMEEAKNLLSLKKASVYLSIILKSEKRNHTKIDLK